VRGLATSEITQRNRLMLIWREFLTGCAMGVVLAALGFARVWLFSRDVVASFAIASTLLFIVVVATSVGALLPLLLLRVGSDPANAGPAVQVRVLALSVLPELRWRHTERPFRIFFFRSW
jgi:magnesium transporter